MDKNPLQTSICEILSQTQKDELQLVDKIEQLAAAKGSGVFSEALRQLVGKDFPSAQAQRYWQEALQLSKDGCDLGCNYRGVRSSLLNYLFRVAGEMRDPRVIEAEDLAGYRHASITDGLTGLYHQSYFKAHLNQLIERMHGLGCGLAVVMLDLDHFKQFNDRCGHLAGDQALRQVADILLKSIRQGDLAARYGGEEFALILHRLNRPQAAMVTERVRLAIEQFQFAGQENLDRGNLTISGGIVFYPDDAATAADLLLLADERLYKAKSRRNAIYPFNQDQRRSRRYQMHSLVEFSLAGEDSIHPAVSRDLSGYGMTLDCATAFPPGTHIRVHFRQPFWPSDQTANCVVRHVHQEPNGQLMRIGLEFEQPTPPLDLLLGFLPTT